MLLLVFPGEPGRLLEPSPSRTLSHLFELGFRKFRGDVHVDNAVALKMYDNFGWVVDERRESEESGLAYVSMVLEREPS